MIMMIVSVAGIGLQQKIRKIYYHDKISPVALVPFPKNRTFYPV
jgi:hypothetical protein